MTLPTFMSPLIVVVIWIFLIYLRSKNSTTTFFDVFIVMFSIGLYALFQVGFFFYKGSALADSVVLEAFESALSLDPTEKLRSYLKNSVTISEDDYATKKSAIDKENTKSTWKTVNGHLLYIITTLVLAGISLFYHLFREKREIVSRLAQVAIAVTLFAVFWVEIYLYFSVFTRIEYVHKTEVVKSGLAELKKSMSSRLVAFWNDDKNKDMRDRLRNKAELSDGVIILVNRLETLLKETEAMSSVHGNWAKSMADSVEIKLSKLGTSLQNTSKELRDLIDDPTKPGMRLANQMGQTANLATLTDLSNSVAALATVTTDTPDVDVLLQSITAEAQNLIVSLKTFSRTDLFASYRSTRDVLVELSKQCTSNETQQVASFYRRLINNLNTLVVVGLALYLLSLTYNVTALQRNYQTDFYYTIVTCVALTFLGLELLLTVGEEL